MDIVATPQTLNAIRHAFTLEPPKGPEPAAARILDKVRRDGWITPAEIEGLMLVTDPRLYRLTPREMLKAFSIPLQPVFERPARGARDADGLDRVAATDLARLLVMLEQIGLEIDAGPFCSALVSGFAGKRLLTRSELFACWRAERRPDETVTLYTERLNIHGEGDSVTTPSGYHIRTFWSGEGREDDIGNGTDFVEMMIVTPPGGTGMPKHLPTLHGPRQLRAFLNQAPFVRPQRPAAPKLARRVRRRAAQTA